jgi:hypothetical protein
MARIGRLTSGRQPTKIDPSTRCKVEDEFTATGAGEDDDRPCRARKLPLVTRTGRICGRPSLVGALRDRCGIAWVGQLRNPSPRLGVKVARVLSIEGDSRFKGSTSGYLRWCVCAQEPPT